MRRLWALTLREIRSQVVSPVAWTVAAGHLLLAGFFFFNLVSDFSRELQRYEVYAQYYRDPSLVEQINLNRIVIAGLFSNLLVIFLFIMPVLTMRSFAGERRQGTDELLLTAPVTPGQIVLGKFLGVILTTGVLVVASGGFILILLQYGDPEIGPIWTGMLGLVLALTALASLGLAVSSTTESQVVAGVGSFVLFLMLFVLDWPARTVGGRFGEILQALALPGHYGSFTSGMITSPDVVYFLSLTALGLFTARAVLASQRWR